MSEKSPDPNEPVRLASFQSEPEAAMVVAVLERAEISAQTTGQLTSALRAEAPGDVHVLVRREDVDRARAVLSEMHGESKSDSED